MTENAAQIPLYKCHKEVWALKIDRITEAAQHVVLYFEGEGFEPMTLTGTEADRFRHHHSDLGYLVIYKDDYRSWSPTKAFEEGYTRV